MLIRTPRSEIQFHFPTKNVHSYSSQSHVRDLSIDNLRDLKYLPKEPKTTTLLLYTII